MLGCRLFKHHCRGKDITFHKIKSRKGHWDTFRLLVYDR